MYIWDGDEWRPAREYECFQVEVFTMGKAQVANLAAKLVSAIQTAAPAPPQPGPATGDEVGQIVNCDQSFGFYTLNCGGDTSMQAGDKFAIFRVGQAVGKIETKRVQETVSIAINDPKFPNPAKLFMVGDKVINLEEKT